jgi:hypothetical protein
MEAVKTCKDCGQAKPLARFPKKYDRRNSERRRALCSPCWRRRRKLPLDQRPAFQSSERKLIATASTIIREAIPPTPKTSPEHRKKCVDCGETKLRKQFHLKCGKGSSPGVRHAYCIECHKKRKVTKYRLREGIAVDAPVRRYVVGLSDDDRLDRYLREKFNITLLDFRHMETAQNGVCKICKKPEMGKRLKRLSVDHHHESGKVRGLLCHPCNVAIGLLKDNPENARSAADYLERSNPCQK